MNIGRQLTNLTLVGLLALLTQTSQAQPNPGFCCNPLTVNGRALLVDALPLDSRGILAMVKGDPASPKSEHILFRASLRRAGTIIRSAHEGYTIDLSQLVNLAVTGDELIVEPVNAADRAARRIIKLKPFSWLNPFTWLRSDGC